MSRTRRPVTGLVVVLLADISGITAIAVTAVVATDDGTRSTAWIDGALLAACGVVGTIAWALAVISVARFRRGARIQPCRRLIWCGLLINTIGALAIIAVSVALLGTPSVSLVVSSILATAGLALSVAYLHLLHEHPSVPTT